MKHLTILLLLTVLPGISQAQTNCGLLHDTNSNGYVDIEDFLSILGLFGDVDSDGDWIYDSLDNCIDLTACNYAANPSEPCEYTDAVGICGGGCLSDPDGDGICNDWPCGSSWHYQGYNYATVLSGDQCWFAENLRNELYHNGDSIPAQLSSAEWQNTSHGAVSVFGEGDSNCSGESTEGDPCDESWSLSNYGRLYNWYAVNDDRGLCPSGWHVPNEEEWMEMIVPYWEGPPGESLPGGLRENDGDFFSGGQSGLWWSSTSYGEDAWYVSRFYLSAYVNTGEVQKEYGMSVRCIKDSE